MCYDVTLVSLCYSDRQVALEFWTLSPASEKAKCQLVVNGGSQRRGSSVRNDCLLRYEKQWSSEKAITSETRAQ